MSFVVDTDVCSAYVKAHPLVWNRFLQYSGQLNVVTHNVQDYAKIPGLSFVDWLIP